MAHRREETIIVERVQRSSCSWTGFGALVTLASACAQPPPCVEPQDGTPTASRLDSGTGTISVGDVGYTLRAMNFRSGGDSGPGFLYFDFAPPGRPSAVIGCYETAWSTLRGASQPV